MGLQIYRASIILKDAKFVPVLLNCLHYVVSDRQYKQAYNVLEFLENYFDTLTKKIQQGEKLDTTLKRHSKVSRRMILGYILRSVTNSIFFFN